MDEHTRRFTATFIALLLGMGLVGCEEAASLLGPGERPDAEVTPSSVEIDPTSLRPVSESWPTGPTPATAIRASVVAAAAPANVLIFGDVVPARNELEVVLGAMGHSVTNVASLPQDLSPYDVVWHLSGFLPLTEDEQTRLAAFLAGGGGVHLTGERSCCDLLNGSLETFIGTAVGAGITVGGLGDFGTTDPAFTFNPTAVGDVTTDPNTLVDWSPVVTGGMDGLQAENVLVSHDATSTPVGGAWECGDLADGDGQLTLLMDVNWLDPSANPPATRDPQIANLQTFLQRSCTTTIPVEVDVKPGSEENTVPVRSRGRLPVAILTTPAFDAAEVDPTTVTLGDDDGDDVPVAAKRNGTLFAATDDVDGDGDADLLLSFEIRALVDGGELDGATVALVLNGATLDGTPITGTDAATPVGGGAGGPNPPGEARGRP